MKLLISFWLEFTIPMFFGIGMGPSSGEYREAGNLGNIGNFATSTGESDISTASDFWKAIISGDQSQLSRVLGPAYSNISKRGGEELKTLSEFGTRSGGTAAQQQQIGESERAQAGALEGEALSGAASSLGSMGSGLLSTGLSAHEAAFSAQQTIQQQKQSKLNDIFKSITSVLSALPIPGAAGGIIRKIGGGLSGAASAPSSPSAPGGGGDDMSWMDPFTGQDTED